MEQPQSGAASRTSGAWKKLQKISDKDKDKLMKWILSNFETEEIPEGKSLYHGTQAGIPFPDDSCIPKPPLYLAKASAATKKFWFSGDTWIVGEYELSETLKCLSIGKRKNEIVEQVQQLLPDLDMTDEDLDGLFVSLKKSLDELHIVGWTAMDMYDNFTVWELMLLDNSKLTFISTETYTYGSDNDELEDALNFLDAVDSCGESSEEEELESKRRKRDE